MCETVQLQTCIFKWKIAMSLSSYTGQFMQILACFVKENVYKSLW